jgi:hypothetical protein
VFFFNCEWVRRCMHRRRHNRSFRQHPRLTLKMKMMMWIDRHSYRSWYVPFRPCNRC